MNKQMTKKVVSPSTRSVAVILLLGLLVSLGVMLLLDVRVATWVRDNPVDNVLRDAIWFIRMPGRHFAFTIVVAMVVGLAVKHWSAGLEVVLAGIIAGAAVHVSKWVVGRNRPFRGSGPFEPDFFAGGIAGLFAPPPNLSFPSGDVALAASTAMVVSRYLPKSRPVVWGWAFLVGCARVRIGAHYPSEACLGLLFGFFGGLCAIWVMARLQERSNK